ncbi:RHS repeat-associated protein [Chitinophaga sp. W2I13]|uniref:RHS repeat-associated core domain-containing protein n=1 Tax=Chitinophaga sp. W2I13 TaxID=3373923 RepID=UPI003D24B548
MSKRSGSRWRVRKWALGGVYRYGFNGKENDNEVKGEGNQQDYGLRIYDPRIAKFLSVDPITAQYPELTPYQFASNTPITAIDLDGLEKYDFRGAKVNKLSYENRRWYQDPLGVFGSNSLRSAWNQGVDAVQLDANFAADPKGTISSMKQGIISAVFRGLQWLSETSDDDKADFVRKEVTNVHNYEDIAGSIILGKVGASRSSGLSLGGDAVGEGLTLFKKGNTGVYSGLEVPMRLKEVRKVAQEAGVGLKGVKIKIDRDASKMASGFPYLASAQKDRITLFPRAFTNYRTLVETLGHERTHVMQYRIWGTNPSSEMITNFENAAYNIEGTFWNYYKTNKK